MSSKKYQFWFSYDAGAEKLHLPVLPEKITVKSGSNNENVDVAGLGGITIMQDRPAYTFSWDSFFPAGTFPGVQFEKLRKPINCAKRILKWQASDKPVLFTVTAMKINIYCTIENFTYYEKGGDPGTIYYSITLKEYREVKVRQVKVKKSGSKKKATTKKSNKKKNTKRANNKKKSSTYKVKKGDCLWAIAKKLYGSGSKYTKIYNANKKKIGGNPNKIKVGMVLSIPK